MQAIYNQITGNNLYINGPILRQRTGDRARIFAPATYSTGSSLYHLNEATYPAGTPNALMTPNLSNAEAIHDPGPIVRAFFEDMEWKTTSLLHEPLTDFETVTAQVVTARLFSDTTLGTAPPKLLYRQQTNTAFREVDMVRQSTTNVYSYTLPAAELTGTINYFLRTTDATGRVYTNPGRDLNDRQAVYSFTTGLDRTPPTITHTPEQTVLFAAAADTIPIIARVTDDRQLGNARKRGIDTVFVQYQINGQDRPPVPLFLLNPDFFPDSTWGGLITIPRGTLRGGDVLRYRIVARDLAAARNQAVNPATGFYEITILAPQATVRPQYFGDFTATTAAADFGGNGFRIETPRGFSNPSINSDHPYRNGADLNNESNYTYTLLAPIRVKANPDSAKIRFDEIVLVEPNDLNSVFGGEGFYDYAIVEASKDNGLTWLPLIDGYNSRARPEWLTAYNSLTAVGLPQEVNSTAVGTTSLLRPREISLLDNGQIRPNDVVLIRFRLFADQLAHGWGWLVDNLYVQQARPVILANEPALMVEFAASPNPAINFIRVTGELRTAAESGTLTLTSPSGQFVQQVPVPIPANRRIDQRLDVSQLPSGLYFLQLSAGDARQVKKIMVTH